MCPKLIEIIEIIEIVSCAILCICLTVCMLRKLAIISIISIISIKNMHAYPSIFKIFVDFGSKAEAQRCKDEEKTDDKMPILSQKYLFFLGFLKRKCYFCTEI